MSQIIINLLRDEHNKLTTIAEKIKARLAQAPDGSLNTGALDNAPVYYHVSSSSGKVVREYIRKEDRDLACQLAQKQYDTTLLKQVDRQSYVIRQFLERYHPEKLINVYTKTPKKRKDLIIPEFIDDDTFVQQWESVTYPPGIFENCSSEYYTARGERVRSKTEMIIADTLYYAKIPYRYEFPLQLMDGSQLRPDFHILNKYTRKEYYLEHFGMMDDPGYCSAAINKISLYMKNGFFPGEQLLFTFESNSRPLSKLDLNRLIDHYFEHPYNILSLLF